MFLRSKRGRFEGITDDDFIPEEEEDAQELSPLCMAQMGKVAVEGFYGEFWNIRGRTMEVVMASSPDFKRLSIGGSTSKEQR